MSDYGAKIEPYLSKSSCPDGWIIARISNPPYTEYWNPLCWAGSGHLFTDYMLAKAVCELVKHYEKTNKENP